MPEPIIQGERLTKVYRVPERPPGMAASIRSLFKSAFTDVPAVIEISFTVQPGEMHGLIRPRAGEVHQRIQLTFRNRPRLVVTIRLSMYD